MVKTKLDDTKQKNLLETLPQTLVKGLICAVSKQEILQTLPIIYDLKGLEKRDLVAFL